MADVLLQEQSSCEFFLYTRGQKKSVFLFSTSPALTLSLWVDGLRHSIDGRRARERSHSRSNVVVALSP